MTTSTVVCVAGCMSGADWSTLAYAEPVTSSAAAAECVYTCDSETTRVQVALVQTPKRAVCAPASRNSHA